MAANGLYSTYIYVGQALVIPGTMAGSEPAPAPSVPPPALPPPAAPAPARSSEVYMVQRGDALWQIAQRYHVTISDLMLANGLYNPNLIYAGQALSIPNPGSGQGKTLNVGGRTAALSLDCEARSAVDWAAYFGVAIDELEFLRQLPVSDDPNAGFVGSVYGLWGQVPPGPYGVYAGPVAALLQAYGVKARAASGLTWDAVRAEIDANRPVIAWVIGQVVNGAAQAYTAPSSNQTMWVAPYEHTVIVSGYGPDTVMIVDGGLTYSRSLAQFMASWGVLGNMAVLAN
jgi:LysM repeat protein